jgi:hypothetical protein
MYYPEVFMSKLTLLTLGLILALSSICCANGGTDKVHNFFPFGIWYQGYLTDKGIYQPTMAEDISSIGINFAIANCYTELPPDSPDKASLASMLNLADKTGIKMLVGLSPLIKTQLTALKPAEIDAKHDEIKAKLAPFVEEGRKHPSLLGWWLGDEPITAGVEKVKSAEKLRLIFAELDPDHPAWCEGTWSVLERDAIPHLKNLNEPVYMPEVYPFWNRPYQAGLGDFRNAGFVDGSKKNPKGERWISVDLVDQYKALRPHLAEDRALWPWLASFREASYEAPNWDWRAPTATELRCLAWISLAEGCRGLAYFGYEHMRSFGDHALLFPAIKSIHDSVAPLTDVLLDCRITENIASVKGGGSRYYKTALVETFKDSHSTPYLIVVNRNCEETGITKVSVSASLPKAARNTKWFAVDPATNAIIAVGTSSGIKLDLDMLPGDGKMIRLISSAEIHPAIDPDIKWAKVGDEIPFKVTGGIYPTGKTFYRWSMTGFPAGTLDKKTGNFKAIAAGRCTIWARDEAGNSAFTRDIVVE